MTLEKAHPISFLDSVTPHVLTERHYQQTGRAYTIFPRSGQSHVLTKHADLHKRCEECCVEVCAKLKQSAELH